MLRIPIKFNRDYSMSTIEEGTDEYYGTLIANALRIEPEELPLSTFFGTIDPSFGTDSPLKIVQNIARYIPEILIEDVSSTMGKDGKVDIAVQFSIRSET